MGCTINNNTSPTEGGGGLWQGYYNDNATMTVVNCTLAGNNARYNFGGGAILMAGTNLTLTNCVLDSNTGNSPITFYSGTSTITGCTLDNNSGALNILSGVTLTNDILNDGLSVNSGSVVSVTYCDIQGGYPGTGNIDADPVFVRAPSEQPLGSPLDFGDLHLQYNSPCLGAGTINAPAYLSTDLDGVVRPNPPSIGAYELAPLQLVTLTVPSPVDGGTIVTATVTLNRITPSDVVVGLSSSNSAVVRVFRSVVVPAGSSSATFTINTYRSHVTQSVTIQASLGSVVLTEPLVITGR